MWIVTMGVARFENIYGPFKDFETAERWVESHANKTLPCTILPLDKPIGQEYE